MMNQDENACSLGRKGRGGTEREKEKRILRMALVAGDLKCPGYGLWEPT
jgi:hypothetical protein